MTNLSTDQIISGRKIRATSPLVESESESEDDEIIIGIAKSLEIEVTQPEESESENDEESESEEEIEKIEKKTVEITLTKKQELEKVTNELVTLLNSPVINIILLILIVKFIFYFF